MTITMFLIMGLLAVFGGLLAYGGDFLGRWFGKRRLTLFGMRPRYTAIAITTATGCLTVVLTAVGMTIVNEAFREWITRGDMILVDLRRNETRFNQLQADNKILESDNKTLESRSQELQTKLSKLEAEYQEKSVQVRQLESQLKQSQKELRAIEGQLRIAQQQTTSLRRERGMLLGTNSVLHKENRELERQRAKLRKQNDDFAQENIKMASENAKLESENTRLTSLNASLSQQNRSLLSENEQLEKQNKDLSQRNTNYSLQVERMQKQYAELVEKVQDLAQQASILVRPMIVHTGEEVLRRSLPAKMSEFQVRQAIRQMMTDASKIASERGAAPEEGDRVLFIPERVVRLADGSEVVVDESASLETITQEVLNSKEPVVMIVQSLFNVVEGEPVRVDIKLYRDRMVFTQGAEIASVTVENHPNADILNAMLRFLKEDVRDAAIEAGVIPRIEYTVPTPSVGEIGGTQLLDLLQRTGQTRGKVRITARAQMPIRAGDPLKLLFDVKPVR
jgi:uncharacterized protein (DUF3084 family)